MAEGRMSVRVQSSNIFRQAKSKAKLLLRQVSKRHCTQALITADLRALGVRGGETLLVHSSLSALGYVEAGAKTVIAALLDAVGPEGTLVLPTHSWSQMSKGCRRFDAAATPSCVGTISEFFRTMPGVVRSLHPTHSMAAIGPLADTPCGWGTPYERIMESNGQILFGGVTLQVNTAFHGIKAMGGVDYLMRDEPDNFQIIDVTGKERAVTLRRHRSKIPRRFAEMEGLLAAERILQRGSFCGGESRIVAARPMRDFFISRLKEDPKFLLDQKRLSHHYETTS